MATGEGEELYLAAAFFEDLCVRSNIMVGVFVIVPVHHRHGHVLAVGEVVISLTSEPTAAGDDAFPGLVEEGAVLIGPEAAAGHASHVEEVGIMVDALFDGGEEVFEDFFAFVIGHSIFEFVTADEDPAEGIGALAEIGHDPGAAAARAEEDEEGGLFGRVVGLGIIDVKAVSGGSGLFRGFAGPFADLGFRELLKRGFFGRLRLDEVLVFF